MGILYTQYIDLVDSSSEFFSETFSNRRLLIKSRIRVIRGGSL